MARCNPLRGVTHARRTALISIKQPIICLLARTFETGDLPRCRAAGVTHRAIALPGKRYMAQRIRRVGGMPQGPRAAMPGAMADD